MYGTTTTIGPISRRTGKAIESIADQSSSKCSWKRFSNPRGSQTQGLSPMPNHQFRIQIDLDLGKFSGSDLVPTNELTFEQWLSDIRAYQ